MSEGHAVYLLGCEQNIPDISEPCGKPTVAVVGRRSTQNPQLTFAPLRMCQGHAWMHTKDREIEVTWLIELRGV